MEKAPCMACEASKLRGKCFQFLDHNIIVLSIVACHPQYLQVVSVFSVVTGGNPFITTFVTNPKSSRTLENAVAISRPVCDWHPIVSAHVQHKVSESQTFATSTTSNGIDSGTPLCSKCTENAMNAQWLGDVQASVVKLTFPLYFW